MADGSGDAGGSGRGRTLPMTSVSGRREPVSRSRSKDVTVRPPTIRVTLRTYASDTNVIESAGSEIEIEPISDARAAKLANAYEYALATAFEPDPET